MATGNEKKSLRKLLKDQAAGKDVDQTDISEAASRFTLYIIPGLLFFVSLQFVAALPFYWFVNGLIGVIQQRKILSQDKTEMLAQVDGEEVEAEIEQPKKLNAKQKREAMKNKQPSKSSKAKKRR